jgi:simple sugar transport system ATP-binding protein
MALLELKNVSKHFGAIHALNDVSLSLEPGQVVGLMGDNGAGKSTLVKILSGVYPPTSGQVSLAGRPVAFRSPLDARRSGIEMIYQDLALCEDMDVAANIFLGRELRKRVGPLRLLDRGSMAAQAADVLAELGVSVRPDREAGMLSGGERQMVAVARALQFAPRLLLMDEPTAALSNEKVKLLLDLVTSLKQRGVAILLVSHRFTDILHVCDRIIVLRQGRLVGEIAPHAQPAEHTMALMAEYMTGEFSGAP